jgi:hypothetical protein
MNLGFRHNFGCFRKDEYREFYKLVSAIPNYLLSVFQYKFLYVSKSYSFLCFYIPYVAPPPPFIANKFILGLQVLVKIFERISDFRYTQYLVGTRIVSVLYT